MFLLVTLDKNDSVGAALRKLCGHKFLSSPVKFNDDQYMMVDLMDIALAMSSDNETDFEMVLSKPLTSVCNPAHFCKLLALNWTCSFSDAIANLGQSGAHRLLVLNPIDETPVAIISEMDIIQYLCKHYDLIPSELRNKPVKTIMNKNPLVVSQKDTTSETIKRCVKHRYGGVAVVDESHEIQANFSISDLRMVSVEAFPQLMKLTVQQFLEETKQQLQKQVVTCSEETTFLEVMKLMHKNHIHRVYILDQLRKPIGVMTSLDIVTLLQTQNSL